MRRRGIRSCVAIATAIALCPSIALASDPPPPAPVTAAPAPAPAPAPTATAEAAPTQPTATATAGPATAEASPAAPQAQAQPPVTVNAPSNVAVTVNTSQAQAQSQPEQPAAAPPPPAPPPPVVVQPEYPPSVEDHPVYGPRYRASSAVMFTGVGFLVAGPALLLTVTLPAVGLKKSALDSAEGADTLRWEERYLDRAYRRHTVAQASAITALVLTTVGLAMTIGGGVSRARARRAAEWDYEQRRVQASAGGLTIRF